MTIDIKKELEIELTADQEIWLKALYEKYLNNEPTNYRNLRLELQNKISKDFKHDSIPSELYDSNVRLTFLGILYIDPKTKYLQIAEDTFSYIKSKLFENPDLQELTTEEISNNIKHDKSDIGRILYLLNYPKIGNFFHQGLYQQPVAYPEFIKIQFMSDDVFNEYFDYSDFESILRRYIQQKGEEKQKKKSNYTSLPVSHLFKSFPTVSSLQTQQTNNENKELISVKPIFHSRVETIDYKLVFVLMPFKKEWSDNIWALIRSNIESDKTGLRLQCIRADNLYGHIVIEDIWTKIHQAAIIVADMTETNPNVMYEMGIVHTIGKPTILLTQDADGIPFDMKHLRHHTYSNNIKGNLFFENDLPTIVREVYKENYPDIFNKSTS